MCTVAWICLFLDFYFDCLYIPIIFISVWDIPQSVHNPDWILEVRLSDFLFTLFPFSLHYRWCAVTCIFLGWSLSMHSYYHHIICWVRWFMYTSSNFPYIIFLGHHHHYWPSLVIFSIIFLDAPLFKVMNSLKRTCIWVPPFIVSEGLVMVWFFFIYVSKDRGFSSL